MRTLLRLPFYLWVLPATAVGVFIALTTVLSGGHMQVKHGILEVHGGFARWLLHRAGGAAMTFGHVILGRDLDCLNRSRAHERVHVRQFERWGPFMLPLYLVAGLVARWRGGDFHLDNPFEREAYERSDQT